MFYTGRPSSVIAPPASLYVEKFCAECPEVFTVTKARAKRTTLCPACKATLDARRKLQPLAPKDMGTGGHGLYVRGVLMERW